MNLFFEDKKEIVIYSLFIILTVIFTTLIIKDNKNIRAQAYPEGCGEECYSTSGPCDTNLSCIFPEHYCWGPPCEPIEFRWCGDDCSDDSMCDSSLSCVIQEHYCWGPPCEPTPTIPAPIVDGQCGDVCSMSDHCIKDLYCLREGYDKYCWGATCESEFGTECIDGERGYCDNNHTGSITSPWIRNCKNGKWVSEICRSFADGGHCRLDSKLQGRCGYWGECNENIIEPQSSASISFSKSKVQSGGKTKINIKVRAKKGVQLPIDPFIKVYLPNNVIRVSPYTSNQNIAHPPATSGTLVIDNFFISYGNWYYEVSFDVKVDRQSSARIIVETYADLYCNNGSHQQRKQSTTSKTITVQ
jgi:hypothetical protein